MKFNVKLYAGVLATCTIVALTMDSSTAFASSKDKILERIRPIGQVRTAAPPVVAEPGSAEPGASAAAEPEVVEVPKSPAEMAKETFSKVCFGCHGSGMPNTPQLGNKEAWAPRIAQGIEVLYNSAINGKLPMMPPRGTCTSCSDEDLKAVVDYMVSEAK